MLSLSHGLTGAFFASRFSSPFVYVPLALASHYLEDWIPHWDVGTGLSSGKRKRSTALFLGLIDLFLTFAVVWWLWSSLSSEKMIHIVAGMFVGLLPDFLEAPRNFLGWEPKFLRKINEFHESFHFSIPNIVLGLLPQIVLWGVILGLR